MKKAKDNRTDYKAPVLEAGKVLPAILCDSLVEGGLEGITEEDWTI